MTRITQNNLKFMMSYESESGLFRAKIRRGPCMQIGDILGHINSNGYCIIKVSNVAYKAHKLAILYMTGKWPKQVDHINGNKSDNRYINLRSADSFINAQNKHKGINGSASGLIGAHRGGWKGRRWVSEIRHNGKRTYLGIFNTAIEAHQTYLKAKRLLHQGCAI